MARRGENIRKGEVGRCAGSDRTVSGETKVVRLYDPICDSEPDIEFCKVFEEWLERIAQTRKYSTYIKYRTLYRCHILDVFCDDKCTQMTNVHVAAHLTASGLSEGTRRSLLAVIRQVLRYAEREYGIHVPVLSNTPIHNTPHSIEIMDCAEQSRLIRFLLRDSDISKIGIYLCLSTGLRLGEVCALKWDDIDQSRRVLHVNRTVQRISCADGSARTILLETSPKTAFSRREIPLSDELFALLMPYRQDGREYVLCGHKPMEPRTYQNHFKNYLRQINAPTYNFHTLRHTFATNCISSGMDVKCLSEILGHSSVQFTMNRYVHPTMDTKRRYINALSNNYSQLCSQTKITI